MIIEEDKIEIFEENQRSATAQLYRHYDANGALLYIGVSISTMTRLSQHKDLSHWFQDIARVEIEHFPTRAAALKAEREAIRTESPAHNLYHKISILRADSLLQIRVTASQKAAYVKAAQRKGMKLSAWVVEALDREAASA